MLTANSLFTAGCATTGTDYPVRIDCCYWLARELCLQRRTADGGRHDFQILIQNQPGCDDGGCRVCYDCSAAGTGSRYYVQCCSREQGYADDGLRDWQHQ